MYQYDDVKLEVVRSLNSSILNNAFTKLYSNDNELVPEYDYAPNIWENKWYNDNVIPGYSKGYCVWKNAYTNIADFLESYGDIIYNYAQENDMIREYLNKRISEINGYSSTIKELWRSRYFNVISGYAKETSTSMTMNSKVRFVKVVIAKDQWPSVATLKLGNLKFKDSSDHVLSYPRTCYFQIENLKLVGGSKIEDFLTKEIQLQRVDSSKEASVTIDFGRASYTLKKYPFWQITSSGSRVKGITLLGSTDGEDYAQIAKVDEFADKDFSSGTYSNGKIRVWNETKYVQYLDPLFDYGPYNGNPKQRIELYVSTIDNNKELLSNRTAWNCIVLSDQNEYDKFISTEISILFADHMKNYHLDGLLSSKADVDALLMSRDLSNFSLDLVPTQLKVREHDEYMNSDGFDYVISSKWMRTPVSIKGTTQNMNLYRWYRLWNSGYLEHGGLIKCPSVTDSSEEYSMSSNYYVEVDLSWDHDDGVVVYNYPETSGYVDGEIYTKMYFGNKLGNPNDPVVGELDATEMTLQGSRYSVSITPVVFNYARDIDAYTGKFNDVSVLSQKDYPDESLSNKVSSYITTEVHHVTNHSFCFTKSDTDRLSSNDNVQLYMYHTSGFRKITS